VLEGSVDVVYVATVRNPNVPEVEVEDQGHL
jgi:hypothetical protein